MIDGLHSPIQCLVSRSAWILLLGKEGTPTDAYEDVLNGVHHHPDSSVSAPEKDDD